MSSQDILIKAIRSGRLSEVCAALDAGAPLDATDEGEAGLAMGMACFLGHVDIVRELVRRGARADLPDNALPTSPLSMAVRGRRSEVVRLLLELGARIPAGMQTGLSDHDIMLAQWRAFRDGNEAGLAQSPATAIEEIVMVGRSDTDTQILEADVLRRAVGGGRD